MDSRQKSRPSRQGNTHQIKDDDDESIDLQARDIDDSSVESESSNHGRKAYAATQRYSGATMTKETWQSLDKVTQSHWDKIPPPMKAKILNCAQECADRARERSANATDVSGGTNEAEPLDSHEDTPNDASEETGKREASVARGSNAHPGDVRRVMGKQPAKGSRKGHNVNFDVNTVREYPAKDSKISGIRSPSDEWGDILLGSRSQVTTDTSPPDPLDPWETNYQELDSWGGSTTNKPQRKTPSKAKPNKPSKNKASKSSLQQYDPFDKTCDPWSNGDEADFW